MAPDQESAAGQGTHAQFQATHWSLVLQAGNTSLPQAQDALSKLCQTYWFPLYAFIRREGIDSHQAKDLTQGFFLHLLESKLIKRAASERGRFRSFLLTCFKNFMKDEWRKEKALKRGGMVSVISIDEKQAEESYTELGIQEPDSVKTFDRAWAATVIAQVMQHLKQSYSAKGKIELYEVLRRSLTGQLATNSYEQEALKLKMTKETFQVHLSRFKQAFGKTVRSEIGQLVDNQDINDEIKYLMAAWSGYVEAQAVTESQHETKKQTTS